ncbi:MAG: BT_3928 family protein [Parabacteroides sp.]
MEGISSATLRKILVECSRLLIGLVFVFSGIVKAIDPVGGAIKIGEYLTSFDLLFLLPAKEAFSFGLSALEFSLGVCVLAGVYRKYTSFLVLVFMLFMTPLTLYLALFNPVSDCGCFGEALVLTNWQTFYKNILLLAAACVLFRDNQRMWAGFTYHAYWFVPTYSYTCCILFAYYNYAHLPVIDFRPYKVGANIPELMQIPEGAPEDEYRSTFIYEKEGVRKRFSLEEAPLEDSTWVFVDTETELVRKGYTPPIAAFNLYTTDGEDVADSILQAAELQFLLIFPKVEEADDEAIDAINSTYDFALEHHLGFYGVTGSSEEAIQEWVDNTGAEYPFLQADDVMLKTMIRSNPGLMLLRQGTVLRKWHYHDIPSEVFWNTHTPDDLSEIDRKNEEEGSKITNLFTFAVPLLLVWVYDCIRHRRRQKRKQEVK